MSAAVLSPAGPGTVRPNLRVVRLSTAPSPRSVAVAHRTVAEPRVAHDDRRAGAAGGQQPLRLTARGRVVVVVLGLLLAIGVSTIAARASADGPASSAVEVTRHVVLEGETMWGLAQQVAAPGEDVRDVVLELVRLNDLPSAGLMAGQEILLPRS